MEKTENQTVKKARIQDDVVVGLGIILFAVSIFLQVPGSYGDVMLFPTIVGIVALLCGIMITASALSRPTDAPGKSFAPEAICLAITAFMYVVMMAAEWLGFFACLFIICFGINQLIAVFCREKGTNALMRSLIRSIIMCGLTYVVFHLLLGILAPQGILV